MKLNRNNYEEYFILYLDNELDSECRREVEAFAKQNPDLKAELDLLAQSKLAPDEEINFTEKGSLMRFDSSSVSLSNYEEWLTSYIDDELTEGERGDVEVFIAGNPAIQRELNLLQQTKLQPEVIVFPGKESLYRQTEKARVVSVRWWRIAAAAVLLLGISSTAIFLINNKKGTSGGDVASKNRVIETNIDTTTHPVTGLPNEKAALVIKEKKDEPKESRNTIAVKQKDIRLEEKKGQPDVKKEEPVIVQSRVKQSLEDLLNPESNSIMTGNDNYKDAIAGSKLSSKGTLTPSDKILDNGVVTAAVVETSDISEQPSGNKGLRGFLRKVTRTIEKRTNIKATDDDDRLLVAGLAIKL